MNQQKQPRPKQEQDSGNKIRLDDLLPKKNVTGGNGTRKVVFGLTPDSQKKRRGDY